MPNNEDGWPTDPTKYLDSDGDGIEDGDENFLMAKIPKTSAGAVLSLAMFVGIAAGIGGFFLGQRRLGFRESVPMWTEGDEGDALEAKDGEL